MAAMIFVLPALALLLFTAGCAGSEREDAGSGDTARDSPAPQLMPSSSAPDIDVPPRDSVSANPVNWTIPLVMARLADATLTPTFAGPVRVRHMRVPGSAVSIAGAELEVYIYGDAIAAAQDVDALYERIRLPGGATAWDRPPTLVTANNLAILIHGLDPAGMERVRKAFNPDHVYPQLPPEAAKPPR